MRELSRRETLSGLSVGAGLALAPGVAGGRVGATGSASSREDADADGRVLSRVGHSLLGGPSVEFAEGDVRPDGRYAAIGTWYAEEYGSFLVDLGDPTDPRRMHFLRSPDRVMNMDVTFGPRNGLYYRVQQPVEDQEMAGVEIVDYGYGDGTPSSPRVIGRAEAGSTHNVFVHPEEPLLYAVNHDQKEETKGVEVWDVSDPTAPSKANEVGLPWSLHDVTVDAKRDLLHCAYGEGYVCMDASDPRNPTELGRFSYRGRKTYDDVGLGNEGFEFGHFARADPRRDLVVMGDEVSKGVPGGKHVFDIGWGDGSPENPVPVGFTTSPNARVQERLEGEEKGDNVFDWTGHNFDVVPWGDRTLLVSGDWHEGVVLYDITDPTAPTPVDRYATDDEVHRARDTRWGEAPMAWSAVYNEERELVVASDLVTGVYTFHIGDHANDQGPAEADPDGSGPLARDDDDGPTGSGETPVDRDACAFWDLWCIEWPFDLRWDGWF